MEKSPSTYLIPCAGKHGTYMYTVDASREPFHRICEIFKSTKNQKIKPYRMEGVKPFQKKISGLCRRILRIDLTTGYSSHIFKY